MEDGMGVRKSREKEKTCVAFNQAPMFVGVQVKKKEELFIRERKRQGQGVASWGVVDGGIKKKKKKKREIESDRDINSEFTEEVGGL